MLAFLAPFLPALKAVGKVLAFGITIPLGVVLAAGLWVHFDKSSAVRSAVDRAVTALVADAEIKAAKAEAEAQRRIAAEYQRQAERARMASDQFAALLAESRAREEGLQDEIDELAAAPVNDACIVDGGILGRLHNR